MEVICQRCHRPVQGEDCYCPACGLPQLFYSADETQAQSQPERWNEAVRDAGTVAWKPALRVALLLAVPAGLLCSGVSSASRLGLFWMSAAAAWAVVLYVRGQQTPWITIGAGARIGLVTGIMAGWLAFGLSGGSLFVRRFFLHRGAQIDGDWRAQVEATQQLATQVGAGDAAQIQAQRILMLTPWGHAGFEGFGIAFSAFFLLFFAVAGGAVGARLLVRPPRPGV
jgi:hypothetical protein